MVPGVLRQPRHTAAVLALAALALLVLAGCGRSGAPASGVKTDRRDVGSSPAASAEVRGAANTIAAIDTIDVMS